MSPLRAPRTRIVVLSQPSAGGGEGFVASRTQRAMRRIRRAAGRLRGAAPSAGPPELARAPAVPEIPAGAGPSVWARVVATVRSVFDQVLRWFGLR